MLARLDASERLRQMAKDCLAEAKNDTTKAISLMVAKLVDDRVLLKELVAPVVLHASSAMVARVIKSDRGSIMRSASRESVVALASGLSQAMLDFPMAGGRKLREATRADVTNQAEIYEKQGSDMLHKARWLRAIAQCVPDDKKVGDVVTDERAFDLWRESKNA